MQNKVKLGTHLVTELRNDYGRSSGYTYANNGSVQQTVSTGYGTDGRIASAGFVHGGAQKLFTYSYLPGTNLLQTLVKPNNMTLTQSYESQRDLLTGMTYARGATSVAIRTYAYDAAGRPTTRSISRQGGTRNDSFTHNDRSELTAATLGTDTYAYDYDNIGNRKSAQELAEETTYTANELNQYTAINDFEPAYDSDGNQTRIQTSTGIWLATYNALNRPVRFENEDGSTVITADYDYMGRRVFKKVESIDESGTATTTSHLRFLYRDYLQIAALDLTRTTLNALRIITWDPTQPIATRPLAIQTSGSWFTYGWDLTKNIMELYGPNGYVRTTYSYTPYGKATASGDIEQPIQWSSEAYDSESNFIYYNWRYYNVFTGNFIQRDKLNELYEKNPYNFVSNSPAINIDIKGLERHVVISGGIDASGGISILQAWAHDRNWRNFITGAKLMIQKIKAEKPSTTIEWMVERKSYAVRDILDNALNLPMPNNHGYRVTYVPASLIDSVLSKKEKEIETIAKTENVVLRWFSSHSEFNNSLQNDEGGHQRGVKSNNAICTLHYFGHGIIGKLLLRPHFFPWNPEELSVGSEVFKASYFSRNPEVYLHTCHSASTMQNKVPKSLAEQISIAIHGYVMGYDGRIDYSPAADNKPPQAGSTIDKDADRVLARGTPDNYHVLTYEFDNRIL